MGVVDPESKGTEGQEDDDDEDDDEDEDEGKSFDVSPSSSRGIGALGEKREPVRKEDEKDFGEVERKEEETGREEAVYPKSRDIKLGIDPIVSGGTSAHAFRGLR